MDNTRDPAELEDALAWTSELLVETGVEASALRSELAEADKALAAARARTAAALDVFDAVLGDMACGLAVGGNGDSNLADYLARLKAVRERL